MGDHHESQDVSELGDLSLGFAVGLVREKQFRESYRLAALCHGGEHP